MSVAAARSAATAPRRLTVAQGDDALALLDARWDDLQARQPLPNPTLSSTWLRAAAQWPTGTPLVVLAEEGGRLLAGAALELRRPYGRLGPVYATWLGPFEQLFSPDLLADPERPEAGATVLAAALEHADVLRLEGTPTGGAATAALTAAAPWHRAKRTGTRWVVPCPLPRLDHVRGRIASEVARAERAGAAVTVRVAQAPDEVETFLVRLFRIHRERWRDRPGEQPRFATTRLHRRWNAGAIVAMAELGRVRLVEVLEDGRPVAGDLGLLHGTGGLAHTTAMRATRALEHPGHVATLACIEALMDAGATAVDFGLGGGEPGGPKHRFGPTGETVHALVAARSATRQRQLDTLSRLRRLARPPRTTR